MKIALTSDWHMGHSDKTAKYIIKSLRKLVKEHLDLEILIIAGDLSSSKIKQFRSCLSLLRQVWKGITLIVKGNHDYWAGENKDKSKFKKHYGYSEIFEEHEKACEEFNVMYLGNGNGPWTNKELNIRIYGFDGWYHSIVPPTNDEYWMPIATPTGTTPHKYMNAKAYRDFYKTIDGVSKTENIVNILVTHFPPFANNYLDEQFCADPAWLEEITKRFDMLLFGHTHQYYLKNINNCLIMNSGSDYNQPRYKIFEVGIE